MSGRALIVDDTKVNRMLLRRGLAEQGVDVLEAEDGRQALDLLATEPVDVILLDLLMPVLDGYATLEQIKADEALRQIPVIVITAVEDLESVVRCIELGATDYLPKPFNAAVLRARVSASLAGKRLRDLELEYLEQVGHVIRAAGSVEAERLAPQGPEAAARVEVAAGGRCGIHIRREQYRREGGSQRRRGEQSTTGGTGHLVLRFGDDSRANSIAW